jgi:hypothetical protein
MTTKNFDTLAILSNGKPITSGDQQATYKDLISTALGLRFEEDARTPVADLYKRGKLADKVDAGGDVTFEADELAKMKEYVAKAYAPRIITAIHDKIEADYTPGKS